MPTVPAIVAHSPASEIKAKALLQIFWKHHRPEQAMQNAGRHSTPVVMYSRPQQGTKAAAQRKSNQQSSPVPVLPASHMHWQWCGHSRLCWWCRSSAAAQNGTQAVDGCLHAASMPFQSFQHGLKLVQV